MPYGIHRGLKIEKNMLLDTGRSGRAINRTTTNMMPQIKFDSEVFLCYTIGDPDGTYNGSRHNPSTDSSPN